MSKLASLLEDMQARQIRMEQQQQEILIQTIKTNGQVDGLKKTVYGSGENEGLAMRTVRLEHFKSRAVGIGLAIGGGLTILTIIIEVWKQ